MTNGTEGPPDVWVLCDDRAGNVSQALGVAEALGMPFLERRIDYAALAALPNVVLGASLAGLTPASREQLVAPWPRLVVAAGRRTAPVALWIRRAARADGRDEPFLAQIMYPGRAAALDLDLVAVPSHDSIGADSPNALEIVGAPHRAFPERLAAAAAEWRPRWASLPRPWIALLVGGATRRRPFTPALAAELGRLVTGLASDSGGSVLVSTSRRTGTEAEDAVIGALPAHRFVYRWGDGGPNPYLGLLGAADAVVVTGDSVSMCSEACGTEGPVYIFAPSGTVDPKHARLHRILYDGGYARPLDGTLATWTHPRLNAAADVAAAIRRAVGAR